MFHELRSEEILEHAGTDGNIFQEVVDESEDEPQRDAPGTKTPPQTVKPISATMSREDFQALRERDPVGALEFVMSLDIFSPKVSTEASTDITSELLEDSRNSLLDEFRTQILEVDLLQTIEQDESIIAKTRDLLHRFSNSFFVPKFVQFVVDLGSTLDQIEVDLQKQKEVQANLEDRIKRKDALLAVIEKSKEKIDSFKEEVPNVQVKLERYDRVISNYENAIRDLESKKQTLSTRNEEIKQEASFTIERIEEFQKLDVEVNRLTIEKITSMTSSIVQRYAMANLQPSLKSNTFCNSNFHVLLNNFKFHIL